MGPRHLYPGSIVERARRAAGFRARPRRIPLRSAASSLLAATTLASALALAALASALALAALAALPARSAETRDRYPAPPRRPCGGVGPNLVRDGSFEEPVVRGPDFAIVNRGGRIGPWTVVSGAVDFIACGFWQAGQGCQSVDLNSCEPAVIEQRLAARSGKRYALCFSLAGNSDKGPVRKRLEVWWAGARVDLVDFDSANRTRGRMGWTRHSYAVTAPSDTVVLRFRSVTPGCYGPVIDDVVVRELETQVAGAPPTRYSFITRASSSVSAGTTW